MSYYGAQIGNEDYYKRILNLREKDEVFYRGTCRMGEVSCDDGKTVALLWNYQDKWALFVGNLERKEKAVRLSFEEEDIWKDGVVWDLYTGGQREWGLQEKTGKEVTLHLRGADCLMVRSGL